MIDLQHKVRIAVDVSFLLDQYSSRGIGRYGKEIVARLIRLAQSDAALVPELHLLGFGELGDNLAQLDLDMPGSLRNVTFHTLGPIQLSSPIANIRLYYGATKIIIKKLRPDFYFAMHFDRGLPSDFVSTVVTIHDVIPLVTGQYSRQGALLNMAKGWFYKFMWSKVRKAKLVFTSSNFSKRDLVKYGKLDADKVEVIYLGIADYFHKQNITKDQKLIDSVLGPLGLLDNKSDAKPYMLYDSGLESNKNIPALLEIFSKLGQREPELKLVLTGGDFERDEQGFTAINERSQSVMQVAAKLNIRDRIVPTGRISEQDLVILLSEAREYINMSGYEGFGFGPIQAMAAGVPVIISNRGSFPEVAGIDESTQPAAIMVDPDQTNQAAAKIMEALSNETAIVAMVQQGFKQAEKYDWDHTFNSVWTSIVNLWKIETSK